MPPRKKRDPMDEMPSGEDAAKRWGEFTTKLDTLNANVMQLNENIAQLAYLGESIVQTLEESARLTQNPLLGLIQQLSQSFNEAKKYYGQGG